MKLKIIKLGDERLFQKSQDVILPLSNEDQKLANDLINYLDFAALKDNDERPGVGIAAVQIGILKRIFAVRIPIDKKNFFKEVLVNPVIISSKGKAALDGGEGCLSVPEDRSGLVHRKHNIKVKGYSAISHKWLEYDLSGFVSIVFQHELDHLDGKLYFSKINPLKPQDALKGEIII